ncbi:zinc finger, CCHC-type containing protein [Tanacetum coccineum]
MLKGFMLSLRHVKEIKIEDTLIEFEETPILEYEVEMLEGFILSLRHVKEIKIGDTLIEILSLLEAKGLNFPSNLKIVGANSGLYSYSDYMESHDLSDSDSDESGDSVLFFKVESWEENIHGSKCWFKDVWKRHNQTGQNGWDELYSLEGKDEISVDCIQGLLCSGRGLHSVYPSSEVLYDLYTPLTSAKEIWNSLEEKYTAEKEGAEKFITFKFFEFALKNNISILDQIQKHLRIKEETRIRENNMNGASTSKVNYVDSGRNNKGNDKKRKGTWNSSKDNKKDRKPLSKVVCYKCGDKGHIKCYYKNPKKKNDNSNKKDKSANAVEQVDTTKITAMAFKMNIGMIQELHTASVTTTNVDFGVIWCNYHIVCNNKDLFKTYKETEDGHEVMMGDNHTSKVIVSGNVEIQFTSGKNGVKDVIESDKVIMSKANVFVGKVYACNGMFKLNINKITSSAYLPDCLIHQRTTPYTPQQNGVAERKNRVLQDMINAIVVSDKLAKEFVGEALITAMSYSNVIVESRDVDFFENKFHHDSTSTNEVVNQIPQDISSPDFNSNNKRNMAESSSAPRISERARKERNLDLIFIVLKLLNTFFVEGDNENNKEEIDDEMDSLIFNNTWELLNLPPGSKAIGSRWVFRIKYHTDGSIQTSKARLIPDIAYVVCKLLRYTSNLSHDHWKAIGSVLGYLKRTRQLALYYDRFLAVVEGYSMHSIGYTSSSDSISNYWFGIFTLSGGVVSWGSKKQTCIIHFTIKAELLALAAMGKEAEWLRNMLLDIEL